MISILSPIKWLFWMSCSRFDGRSKKKAKESSTRIPTQGQTMGMDQYVMWERKHPGHDPDGPSTNWSVKHVWGYWPKHYALNGFMGGKEAGFT